jgi:AcrR family transcriptional regulator
MISYHFGGKDGLYAAVVAEQFAIFRQMAEVASTNIIPAEKFRSYLYQCGICFHQGSGDEFRPFTASADSAAPECPCCLNNDADSFATLPATTEQAA